MYLCIPNPTPPPQKGKQSEQLHKIFILCTSTYVSVCRIRFTIIRYCVKKIKKNKNRKKRKIPLSSPHHFTPHHPYPYPSAQSHNEKEEKRSPIHGLYYPHFLIRAHAVVTVQYSTYSQNLPQSSI